MTHTTIIQVRLSSTLLIAVSSASVALVSVKFFDSPFGFNWGSPNETSFGGADNQYTMELFWRYQLTKELAVTPSNQYIKDPAPQP
jgi:carbohydrate-selective porin OprB